MPEPIQEAPKEKIVFEYQHTDEQGNPIIDPRTNRPVFSNFTGDTWEEIARKQKDAEINASRAISRLRARKAVPKETEAPKPVLTPEQEAARKMAGTDELEKKIQEQEQVKNQAAAERAAYQFMSAHLSDYYPCKANSDILSQYITENELDPRILDNYEIAFDAVSAKLAQRPAPPAPIAPQPDPEPEPAPAPKKQAAGGIQPGQLSGSRPIQRRNDRITIEKMKRWKNTAEGRAEYKKLMRDETFINDVNAFFAARKT